MRGRFSWCAALVALAAVVAVAYSELTVGSQSATLYRLKVTVCRDNSDCNSRGTCADGQCTCNAGYAGSRCDKQCKGTTYDGSGTATVVCSGHGTCIPQLNGYCKCSSGFRGENCTVLRAALALSALVAFALLADASVVTVRQGDDDTTVTIKQRDCSTDEDCVHGNCTSIGFCDCDAGYAGKRCSRECRGGHANPCSGHGTCLQRLAGRCRCSDGWIGADCSVEVPVPVAPSFAGNTSDTNTLTLSWAPPENEGNSGSSLFSGTEYTVETCEATLDCGSSSATQSLEDEHTMNILKADLASVHEHARTASHPLFSFLRTRGGAQVQETSNWRVACRTTGRSCTVTNLKRGTRYLVRTKANFQRGLPGNYSEPISVHTQAEAPDYETRVPIVNSSVTANSIKVNFVQPQDIGGGSLHAAITQYKLEYRKVGDSAFTTVLHDVTGGEDAVTVSSLEPFTTYEFRVSARNVAGYGSPGPLVQQKTAGSCGNSAIESGSLGNGLTYTEQCDGGHCCSGSCTLKEDSYCSSHGSCSTGTTCTCTGGYTGQTCQYSDATTCNGHGSVQFDGSCQCQSAYAGSTCQYGDATTCNGHGTAQSDGSCQCQSGYLGPGCQYTDATTCSGHGSVANDGSCTCEENWKGANCNQARVWLAHTPILHTSSCPPSVAANTDLFRSTIQLAEPGIVEVHVQAIRRHTGQAELRLYRSSVVLDEALGYTPSYEWLAVHLHYIEYLPAGTHTYYVQSPVANIWGCGSDPTWDHMDVIVREGAPSTQFHRAQTTLGCPGGQSRCSLSQCTTRSQTTSTQDMPVTFTLSKTAPVSIFASQLLYYGARTDMHLYIDGNLILRTLTYSPSQWETGHVHWADELSAGTHTVHVQHRYNGVAGCGPTWGNLIVQKWDGDDLASPSAIELGDPRSGCPSSTAANTPIMQRSFTVSKPTMVIVRASLIRNRSGRSDLYLYRSGNLLTRTLTYTNTQIWYDAHIHWVGEVPAGTHNFWVQSPHTGWGCQSQWGNINIQVLGPVAYSMSSCSSTQVLNSAGSCINV